MSTPAFIAGDWGTTHLRLYRCTARGDVLEQAEGAGAAQAKGNFPATLDALIAAWQNQYPLPVLLCGMAGSSIGWKQVEAIKCPAPMQTIAQATVTVDHHQNYTVRIVPGLTCRNVVDAPDFMRGEESQILGAMQLHTSLQQGRHLLCMPGTHTKWVMINNGSVEHFITAPTGELFALLCKHSVLVSDVQRAIGLTVSVNQAFMHGVEEIRRFPGAGLLNRLFECRGRRLSGELSVEDSQSFLSGLLIATDVRDALALLSKNASDAVVIIGNNSLNNLYAHVLSGMNCSAVTLRADKAVCAGLAQVYQLLSAQGVS